MSKAAERLKIRETVRDAVGLASHKLAQLTAQS
jgi:hypothetical protein